MSLWSYFLKETEFKALARFVSPQFFSVISVRETLGVISRMVRSSRDLQLLSQAQKEVAHWVSPVRVQLGVGGEPSGLQVTLRLAEQILEVYFCQILGAQTWLLDFRKERWGLLPSGQLTWAPAAYVHQPSPAFLQAVRALYRGFYQDDGPEFDRALKELGIFEAKSVILSHFGLGDQSSVVFSLKAFQFTFADVFDCCRKAGSRIHPEFALLGAMLVSLYECLEGVQEGIHVRRCFTQAQLKIKDSGAPG